MIYSLFLLAFQYYLYMFPLSLIFYVLLSVGSSPFPLSLLFYLSLIFKRLNSQIGPEFSSFLNVDEILLY